MLGRILFSNTSLLEKLGEDFVSTKEFTEGQTILSWDKKIVYVVPCVMNILAILIPINKWKLEVISLKSQENKK